MGGDNEMHLRVFAVGVCTGFLCSLSLSFSLCLLLLLLTKETTPSATNTPLAHCHRFIQQLPELREHVLASAKKGWRAVAEYQMQQVFTVNADTMRRQAQA